MFTVHDTNYCRSISPGFPTRQEASDWQEDNVCSTEGLKIIQA